ncbi:MAG TPA: hypothetical protein VHC19_08735 [Pirellulales bacterium]|nr:hypothetical protein [Pirellulales bacterium]
MSRILVVALLLVATNEVRAQQASDPSHASYTTARSTRGSSTTETPAAFHKAPSILDRQHRRTGHISRLHRELPKTAIEPPQSRRRQVDW